MLEYLTRNARYTLAALATVTALSQPIDSYTLN